MSDRTFERAVLDWLEDGSDRSPRPAIEAVLLAVRTTPQERERAVTRRFTMQARTLRLVAAAMALVAVLGGGAVWVAGLATNPSPPVSTSSPTLSSTSDPVPVPTPTGAPRPSPSAGESVAGWPSLVGSWPGLFSWDGSLCAGRSCNPGFMHSGYGSGGVAITMGCAAGTFKPPCASVEVVDLITAGATAVTVAGRSGWYRTVIEPEPSPTLDNARLTEEWIIDLDGIWIAIRLYVEPGASAAGVAEAHDIVASLRIEPSTRAAVGYRLIFRLTNDEWDSG